MDPRPASPSAAEDASPADVTPRHPPAGELGPLLRLAGPVVASELGWMTMWLVDIMLVGRIGAEAIGAVSIGGSLFYPVALFGMGMLLGLDFLVASAFGAGRPDEARRALVDGVHLALALTIVLTGVVYAVMPLAAAAGIRAAVLPDALGYLEATTWSLLPLLLFSALRRYLQGIGIVAPMMITIVAANFVNAAVAWTLIFGHFGVPAFGAVGAGWATCFSRAFILACLAAFFVAHDGHGALRAFATWPDWHRIGRLARLGLPAGLQLTLEVGVFAIATVLAGRLAPSALAAHQVALSAAGLTFMVPLGIASAGAVRVGQALGRRDALGARRAGWTALALGAGFMLCAGVTFVLVPETILRAFTSDATVVETGVSLLIVAALFQLFDGVQVVATGILRGTGDTRTAMIANLLGHWLLGLPIGYALCFRAGRGIVGLWCGLSLGLVAVAVALLSVWARRTRRGDSRAASPLAGELSARASA